MYLKRVPGNFAIYWKRSVHGDELRSTKNWRMVMEYILRPADATDLDQVLQWIWNADHLRAWGGPSLSFPPEGERIWAEIKGDGLTTYAMIGEGEEVVGFGQILPRGPGRVHLARIFVSPKFRGKGLGRVLCLQLMGRAVVLFQPHTFSLRVDQGNGTALALYLSLGFSVRASGNVEGSISMKCEANDVFPIPSS